MARLVPGQSYQRRQGAQARDPARSESGSHRFATGCLEPDTEPKPNTDSNNYVGQLSRPQPSTCNSFHFQSLLVEFLESCPSSGGQTTDWCHIHVLPRSKTIS